MGPDQKSLTLNRIHNFEIFCIYGHQPLPFKTGELRIIVDYGSERVQTPRAGSIIKKLLSLGDGTDYTRTES